VRTTRLRTSGTHRAGRPAAALVAVVLAAAGTSLAGCSDDLDDQATAPQLEGEVPDIRGEDDLDDVYTGLLDERFVEDLPAYEDQEVTVLAEVSEVLSPRAFSVTSIDDADVDPVLVVTTDAAAEVEPAAGDELVVAARPATDLDPEVVVGDLGLGVDPAVLEDWGDQAYLIATVVEPAP
jgi:hypothetical protein